MFYISASYYGSKFFCQAAPKYIREYIRDNSVSKWNGASIDTQWFPFSEFLLMIFSKYHCFLLLYWLTIIALPKITFAICCCALSWSVVKFNIIICGCFVDLRPDCWPSIWKKKFEKLSTMTQNQRILLCVSLTNNHYQVQSECNIGLFGDSILSLFRNKCYGNFWM